MSNQNGFIKCRLTIHVISRSLKTCFGFYFSLASNLQKKKIFLVKNYEVSFLSLI